MNFVYKKSDLNFLKYNISISLKEKNNNKRRYLLKVKNATCQGIGFQIWKDRKKKLVYLIRVASIL